MWTAEWIQVGFAVTLAVAGRIRPLPACRQASTTRLAIVAIAVVAAARSTAFFLPPFYVSLIRDWLPVALMLVPYWQTGQFFIEPNEKIQSWLAALDRRWLGSLAARAGTARTRIGLSMEIAYFLCYPLVPLGLGVMFAAGLRNHTDAYWLVVLISTYICYAITPFVPALPPSTMATAQLISSMPLGKGRMLNQWLQRHGSIHAISFPSAHVASALAVSLVLLRFVPFAGLLFLMVSVWIAVAAVVGRYHYALDVLLGAVVALGTFLASYPSL